MTNRILTKAVAPLVSVVPPRAVCTLLTWVGLLAASIAFGETANAQQGQSIPLDRSYESQRASDASSQATSLQARRQVEALFQQLCPGRCELVSLNVAMNEPEAMGAVIPGFEQISPSTGYRASVKAIELTVLLDRKLPASFKQNVPRMLQYRLQSLADTVKVRSEMLHFPEPQLPPMPPPFPEDLARAAPLSVPVPRSEPLPAPVSEPSEPPTTGSLLLQKLAPWLGPIAMLLIALLGAWLLLRRRGTNGDRALEPTQVFAKAPGLNGSRRVDWHELEGELATSRSVRNQLLRTWLEDDEEAVGQLVRVMGASLVDDIKKERRWHGAIQRIARQVTAAEAPLSEDEANVLGQALHARLTAAQLTAGADAMAREWDFLEGASLAAFRRLLAVCDANESSFVMARAPSELRQAFLDAASQAERRDVMMGIGATALSRTEASNLAHRLRRILHETVDPSSHDGGESSLVVDMLESLPEVEQMAVLQELHRRRPQVAESVLSHLVLDSTSLHVPRDVLLDALHRLPVDSLVPYISGLNGQLREHLLNSVTGNRRQTLEGELSLAGSPSRSEHLMARQRFTETLKSSLQHEGHDLYEVNVHALAELEAGATEVRS